MSGGLDQGREGPLGIQVALLEPGPVSSGALDHVTTYTLPGDPYAHLLTQGGARASQMITPEEVAAGIADATIPMLTEPTSTQRDAFDLIGVPIPLTMK